MVTRKPTPTKQYPRPIGPERPPGPAKIPDYLKNFKPPTMPRFVSGGGGGGQSEQSRQRFEELQEDIKKRGLREEYEAKQQAIRQAGIEAEERGVPIDIERRDQLRREGPVSEVQPIREPTGFFGRTMYGIERERLRLETESFRGDPSYSREALGFGLGVTSVGVGAGYFGTQLITDPLGTTKGVVTGIPQVPARLREFAGLFETSPGYATGVIVGEIGLMKGTGFLIRKAPGKVSDIIRTAGKTELPERRIIAGEYPMQEFPSIKRGQTAGQLLKEFEPTLPGETRAGGFTATPTPLAKETTALRGTSELPGLYQAPKLSPHFLRVAGEEKKLFSFNPLETLRPTAVRITPRGYGLVPGVIPGTRQIQSGRLPEIKQFFETAPKGRGYVPFIKTEKEAVIPFGTLLKQTDKRFFFKFEGRRVPIHEFETIAGEGKISSKMFSTKDISRISSSRVGRRARYDPLSILQSYRMFSKAKPSYVSPMVSSNLFSRGKGRGYGLFYAPRYRAGYSGFGYGISGPRLLSYGRFFGTGTRAVGYPVLPGLFPKKRGKRPVRFPDIEIGLEPKPRKERFGRPFHYQPGVASLGLRGTKFQITAPKIPRLVFTGIQTRPVIRKKRRK